MLRDEPGGERLIETLPRRGYRFVGPMNAEPEDSAVMDRQKPAAPLPVLERRRQPLSAGPEDSGGGLPTGRTDLGYTASDPGAAVEKIDRDLLVGEREQVTVLCADLKESIPHSTHCDPHAVTHLIREKVITSSGCGKAAMRPRLRVKRR